jgi:serine protease
MTHRQITSTLLATIIAGVLATSAANAAERTPHRGEAPRVDTSAMASQKTFDRFIVTYRDGSVEKGSRSAVQRSVATAAQRAGLAAASGARGAARAQPLAVNYLRKLAVGSDLVRTSRKLDRVEAEALMRQIATNPAVSHVEPDVMMHAVRDIKAPAFLKAQTFTPDDTYYAKYQWHLKAPDGTATQGGVANRGGANVNNAWDLADGNGVVIAVLDTGLTTHVDIDSSLIDAGYDFIADSFVSGRDTDGRVAGGYDIGDWTNEEPWLSECTDALNPPSASSWHGTHVAGTAGAEKTNNAAGMAGIANGAKVLPVRVLGHCGGYTSDIADGIIWAAGGTVADVPANANPAQVINMSLGGTGACSADSVTGQAVAQANALGAVVVVSAGNSGADAGNYSPASCPGVITVAATGITSKRAFYSNYGATVEIAAPGGGVYANDGSSGTPIDDGFVWQALNSSLTTPVPNDADYGGYAGTSQAAPHVSGVVAMMQGARLDAGMPLYTPAEVLANLQSTAYTPVVTPTQPIGAGIVDALAAVQQAVEVPCDPETEVCGPDATPLTNKVPVTGLAGAGGEALYSFEAEAGSVLSIMTYGGRGDVSVYVGFDEEPTTDVYDSKSARSGNSETVRFTAPQAGTYYIKLTGTYSGLTLVARQ